MFNPLLTTGSGPARPTRSRRLIVAVLAPLMAAATILVPASPASAAGATSSGFACNSTYHWVRHNWPNIRTDRATVENVYFNADLYRWNGSSWVYYRSSGWVNGASTNQGSRALGSLGSVPYYYYTNGTTYIAPLDGWVFRNLPAGSYKTAEYYQTASGASWSNWSWVQGHTAANTYCVA